MVEEKQNAKEEKESVEKRGEEKLPFCTTAASAEHARALNEDEPCDDARATE